MELLTEELKKQLPPLYSQEKVKDPMVMCKFFHPLSSLTWYAIEGSPVDADGYYDTNKEKVDFLFFGWVYGDFPELGYFSLSEMEAINVGGLGMERDVRRNGTCQIASKRQKVESETYARTPDQPGVEKQRGKQHVRKAAKREGMERDALQVLLAW